MFIMTKKEKLLKLHKVAYLQILLKSIEDRTKEEVNFSFWYEQKHTEEANELKQGLKERALNVL